MTTELPGQAFPIPLAKFVQTLKGTPDEVYTHLLRLHHAGENATPNQWRDKVAALKNTRV
jgi:hypothetical protein